MQKKIVFLIWALISALLWFIYKKYQGGVLEKLFLTFFLLAVIYFFFRLVFEEVVIRRIKDSKTKYSFRKTVSVLYIFVFVLIVLRIWVEDAQSLLVAYGIITAGVAIALQDLFKNFAGGIILFITGIYRVGDRIEINSKNGDVMDIGILYTTLMEIKEWVAGDQATGRLTIIPNGQILAGTINNYTKDHNFIWDEISLPITYHSDWKGAHKMISEIVARETKLITEQAGKEILSLEEKYYLSKRPTEPSIFITLTDNWIAFNIRYVTDVRQRRFLRNKLSYIILEEIQKSENVHISSSTTTIDIVGFPEIRLKHNKNTE